MKITIVGAGNVGATCAMRILESGIADVILLDVAESLAKGKAEDLMDCASVIEHGRQIIGTSDYSYTAESSIVVITAGFPRQPGMTREELLQRNSSIVKEVAGKLKDYSKNPIIIVVTNPLDVMSFMVYKWSRLDYKRVIGMAGVLDSSRMNLMVARALNKTLTGIGSLVLGTHGETMVPAVSHSKVDGIKLRDMLEPKMIDDLISKTKNRGAEIISYIKHGSAFYAPSAGVFKMVKAIVENTHEILPCSCLLHGEYGINDVYLGVPAKLCRDGLEEVVELPLSQDEKKLLRESATSVRKNIDSITNKPV